MTAKIDAKAYIEWGGQYDIRELELIEWDGKWSWEDLTGGHMTLHNHLARHDSPHKATQELLRFVFDLGEPSSFVDLGLSGIVRSRDCTSILPTAI